MGVGWLIQRTAFTVLVFRVKMTLWKNPTAGIAARYHGGKYTYHLVEKHLSKVFFLYLLGICAIS